MISPLKFDEFGSLTGLCQTSPVTDGNRAIGRAVEQQYGTLDSLHGVHRPVIVLDQKPGQATTDGVRRVAADRIGRGLTPTGECRFEYRGPDLRSIGHDIESDRPA